MNLPPYSSFPVLTSGTVLLRQALPEDSSSLLEISYYDARPAQNLQEAIEMQEKINADYQNGVSVHWAIVCVPAGEIVGTLGFYRGFEDGIGEFGCVLKPAFRGRGLMGEAMKLAIEFGLYHMKLAQITAITTRKNGPAIKLLESLDFRKTADLTSDELSYFLK